MKETVEILKRENIEASGRSADIIRWGEKLQLDLGNTEMERAVSEARLLYYMIACRGDYRQVPEEYRDVRAKDDKKYFYRLRKPVQETNKAMIKKLSDFVDRCVRGRVSNGSMNGL